MRWFKPWYNKYAVITLSAAAGLGAYEGVPWSKLSPSDWGTWVGAIGTVATLAGTIWLATETERRKRAEQLDLALITAAELHLWITGIDWALNKAIDVLPSALKDSTPQNVYAHALALIEDEGLWTNEKLVQLAPVPGRAAAKLAWTGSRIKQVINMLKKLSEAVALKPGALGVTNDTICRQLSAAIQEMGKAEEELHSFLLSHGFDEHVSATL